MTDQTDFRAFFSRPGESLLLPDNPVETGRVYDRYVHATGIGQESLVSSTLVSVPVPSYPSQGFGDLARWPGTRAQMMWHPLMWLPRTVHTRRVIDETPEEDDVYVVRIALELEDTQMYDKDAGTWRDILALAGLDSGNPYDAERIRAWLVGGSDTLLDGLQDKVDQLFDLRPPKVEPSAEMSVELGLSEEDLQRLRAGYDADTNLRAAVEMMPLLRQCSYALCARSLRLGVEDLSEGESADREVFFETDDDPEYVWSPGDRQRVGSLHAQYAAVYLDGAQETNRFTQLATQIADFQEPDSELVSGPLRSMMRVLFSIDEQYTPVLEWMIEQADAPSGYPVPTTR